LPGLAAGIDAGAGRCKHRRDAYATRGAMNPQAPPTRKQLALLHVAKAQLGIEDGLWREMLAAFGVESSKYLTQAQVADLVKHLQRGGFKPRPRPKGKEDYLRAIAAALDFLGLPLTYADGVAKRMFGIEKLAWCSPDQAHKVQIALMYPQRRRREDAHGGDQP